jgi:hypothetical protein
MRPTSTKFVIVMKQHFMCVEQSTGTIVMYEEVKILMKLISCAKDPAQLSETGLIPNLIGEQSCDGSSEMFHVCIWQCPGAPCSVEAHFATRYTLSSSGSCLQHITDLEIGAALFEYT